MTNSEAEIELITFWLVGGVHSPNAENVLWSNFVRKRQALWAMSEYY